MKESSSVMADAINFLDRNVIMFLKHPFFSCKSLILKDSRWHAIWDGLFNDFNKLQAIGRCFVGHSRSKRLFNHR